MAKNTNGLPPLQLGLLMSEERKQAIFAERVKEEDRRMVALAEQMDIPDGPYRWYFLALELARQHVPELMPLHGDGRKAKWGDFESGVLLVEVKREQEKTDPPRPVYEVTRTLAKRSPWKQLVQPWRPGQTHSSDPGEALRKQYQYATKKRMATLMVKLYEEMKAAGAESEWDKYVEKLKEET